MLIPVIICFLDNDADTSGISTDDYIEIVTEIATEPVVSSTTVHTSALKTTTTTITTTTTTTTAATTITTTTTVTVTTVSDIPVVESVDDLLYAEPETESEEYPTEETAEIYEETYDTEMISLGSMKITGYVSTGSPTASGEMPYVGGVAVNSAFMTDYGLSYGDTVYIDGLGYYTLNDTGCQYGVVDVFCQAVDECYLLTSYAEVYLVK
jgi:hypothetical protein